MEGEEDRRYEVIGWETSREVGVMEGRRRGVKRGWGGRERWRKGGEKG